MKRFNKQYFILWAFISLSISSVVSQDVLALDEADVGQTLNEEGIDRLYTSVFDNKSKSYKSKANNFFYPFLLKALTVKEDVRLDKDDKKNEEMIQSDKLTVFRFKKLFRNIFNPSLKEEGIIPDIRDDVKEGDEESFIIYSMVNEGGELKKYGIKFTSPETYHFYARLFRSDGISKLIRGEFDQEFLQNLEDEFMKTRKISLGNYNEIIDIVNKVLIDFKALKSRFEDQ